MIVQGDILAGRYQIIKKIGQGGAGIVYKAYDLNLQKYVVVKKIRDYYEKNMFDRIEVDILKKLHHPYLPQVYDFLVIDNQVFTVIDFVDGKDLQWYYDQNYILDEKTIRKWTEQLLEVLEYLHKQNPKILHTDIKPANIMITTQGDVCLIDFGISLGDGDFTQIHGASQRYASPEQLQKLNLYIQGQDYKKIVLDERSDIYSLAKSIWKQMELGVQNGAEYTDALWNIIGTAMQERPGDRYASADKMLRAMRNIEKSDKEYRRYFTVKLLIHFGYGVCMIVALLLFYVGYRTNAKEELISSYRDLQMAVENEDSGEMIDLGIKLLNLDEFDRQKNNMSKEWTATLHAVGDGYYMEEKYSSAADYYEQVVEMKEDTEDSYYYDYVSALARAGNVSRAEKAMRSASRANVDASYLSLMESEILLAENKLAEAAEVLYTLVTASGEESVVAYLRLADIYEKQGDFKNAIDCLENARLSKKDERIVRKLGNVYYSYGNYPKAESCFKELLNSLSPIYSDAINYAVCCEMQRDYESAVAILEEMTESYPEKYEAYMHLAFSFYKTRNVGKAEEYYAEAKELYAEAGTQDSMMEELQRVLE